MSRGRWGSFGSFLKAISFWEQRSRSEIRVGESHIMVSNRVRISEPRLTLPPEISRSTTPSGPAWPGLARPRHRGSSSRANADRKTFYWVLTFLLTDGFSFWKAAEKCLIPTPTGLWIEGRSSSLVTWLVDCTLIHSRKAAMLASRTNAARSAPLNKARKHVWLLKLYKVETKENPKVEQRSKIRRLATTHDQIG